jgi:Rrf2 family protein
MLSQTAEYALRAVLYLAGSHGGSPVRVDEIGRDLGIPANYLSKTLNALVRTGVLASTRGPRGGFKLAVAPDRLSLERVISPFDEIGGSRRCLLGREQCSDHHACAIHAKWKSTSDQVAAFFRTTTVAEIAGSAAPLISAVPSPSRSRRTA